MSTFAGLVALVVLSASAQAESHHAPPPSTQFDALLISKANADSMLLGTEDGLYRTKNGGRTWARVAFAGKQVTSLAQSGNAVLAGGNDLLASSTNDGSTWTPLRAHGLPDHDVAALAVDSARPSVVYVVSYAGGLYRSGNRGRSFLLMSLYVGPGIRSLAVTHGEVVAGDVENGIYVSKNGRNWLHTAGGTVMAVAVDPTSQRRILVGSVGISRSSDGGLRWRLALPSLVMFGAVAWAPSRSLLAFAVGDNGSFWQTTDGGRRWTELTNHSAAGTGRFTA